MNEFPANSRYATVDIATWRAPDGTEVRCLRRRFVPPSTSLALLQEHVVCQGDRLDVIAASYIGDPLLFWQVCDANDAMLPERLTERLGRRLRITLPQGVPGAANG